MNRRGQLVLVAAVLIAIAMVPLVLAYLQLGYHADVASGGAHDDPTADARSVLVPTVHDASAGVPNQYTWAQRSTAVDTVRSRLDTRISTVETARIEEGIHRNVTYNQTLATTWAADNCPSGPDRQFGSCEVDSGVVVQERAGETHVLGIGFDMETTTQRERTEMSFVIEI